MDPPGLVGVCSCSSDASFSGGATSSSGTGAHADAALVSALVLRNANPGSATMFVLLGDSARPVLSPTLPIDSAHLGFRTVRARGHATCTSDQTAPSFVNTSPRLPAANARRCYTEPITGGAPSMIDTRPRRFTVRPAAGRALSLAGNTSAFESTFIGRKAVAPAPRNDGARPHTQTACKAN